MEGSEEVSMKELKETVMFLVWSSKEHSAKLLQ